MAAPLPRSFFARDADVVARDLLGHRIVHETPEGRLAARVLETEAYFGPAGRNPHLRERADMPAKLRRRLVAEGDPASHSFPGVTKRNAIMYGAPGFWYVYLIYGMHECANVVTGPLDAHEPQAVLLRAAAPVEGIAPDADVGGPARLTRHLRITRAHYGADATKGPLRFERGKPVEKVRVTPRINVVGGEDLPLRFVAADLTPGPTARRADREGLRGS